MRNAVCEQGLKDAIHYLENEGGEVVVFDATNTTRERRKLLHERVVKEKGFKLFFVESICDDENIIYTNIKTVKVRYGRSHVTTPISFFWEGGAKYSRGTEGFSYESI